MNIHAVLERIAAGQTSAFADVVNHYQRPLFGFLGRMGLAQAQAEDVAQDAFLRAWTHLPSYDPARAQFGTWLFTIARNLAHTSLQSAAATHEVGMAELPDAASDQAGPAQQLQHAQVQQRLQHALRQLPMPERSALALVYVHGLSLVDVARIEGDSLAAIKTRLHRARQKLRNLLPALETPYDR